MSSCQLMVHFISENPAFESININTLLAERTRAKTAGKRKLVFGKSEMATVRMSDRRISKIHCKISVVDYNQMTGEQKVLLKDLSNNGTFVNGVKIGKNGKQELHDGDVVSFVAATIKNKNAKDFPFYKVKITRGNSEDTDTQDEATEDDDTMTDVGTRAEDKGASQETSPGSSPDEKRSRRRVVRSPATQTASTPPLAKKSKGKNVMKAVVDWTVGEVAEWVEMIGLEQYAEAFINNEIDGKILVHMTPQDLRDLNITKVGHRKIIELELQKQLTQTRNKPLVMSESPADSSMTPTLEREEPETKKVRFDPSTTQSSITTDISNSNNNNNNIVSTNANPNDIASHTSDAGGLPLFLEQEKLSLELIEKLQKEQANQEEQDRLLALRLQPTPCPMCLDDFDIDFLQPLKACQHKYCRQCLHTYFVDRIKERKFPIQCPLPDCKLDVQFEDMEDILERQYLEQFQNNTLENILVTNPALFSCCPTPDCGYLFVYVKDEDGPDFKCEKCAKRYCLNCKVDYHVGINCQEYQRWAVDNGMADERFQEFVVGQHFKKCVGCQSWVEKVDGCNHMSCRCGAEFCYRCGRKYPCHGCEGENEEDYEEEYEDEDEYQEY